MLDIFCFHTLIHLIIHQRWSIARAMINISYYNIFPFHCSTLYIISNHPPCLLPCVLMHLLILFYILLLITFFNSPDDVLLLTQWGWDKLVTISQTVFSDHFLEWKCVNLAYKISLKSILKVWINNIPALVQIMARRRLGDKPLSEPMSRGLNELISTSSNDKHFLFVYFSLSLSLQALYHIFPSSMFFALSLDACPDSVLHFPPGWLTYRLLLKHGPAEGMNQESMPSSAIYQPAGVSFTNMDK